MNYVVCFSKVILRKKESLCRFVILGNGTGSLAGVVTMADGWTLGKSLMFSR